MPPSVTLKQGAMCVVVAVFLSINNGVIHYYTAKCREVNSGIIQQGRLHLPQSTSSKAIIKYENESYIGPQRTYQVWPHNLTFPCYEAEDDWNTIQRQKNATAEGLLFVREKKTGSSTLAGTFLRLAHRKGDEINVNRGPCKMRIDHQSAQKMLYHKRTKNKSFLMSLLRHPTQRAISSFFHFSVSQFKTEPTDSNFQSYLLQTEGIRNYYTSDLTMLPVDFTEDPNKVVQEIIDGYDLIGITERMDESLVVMKMLLGLETADILYMSAKRGGSFTAAPPPLYCIYLVPAFLTEGMQDFFASDVWLDIMKYDLLLYRAANKSLDNTIDALGREEFEKQLKEFREVLAVAQTICESETVYRCDKTGTYVGNMNSTCLLWDIGCGYHCLNQFYNPSANPNSRKYSRS